MIKIHFAMRMLIILIQFFNYEKFFFHGMQYSNYLNEIHVAFALSVFKSTNQ